MLELRGQRAIPRHRCPAIRKHFHMRLTEIDHRLHGENHPRFKRDPFACISIMQNVRLIMKIKPDTMAAEIAHDAAPLAFGIALDRVTNIADRRPWPDAGDPTHHCLIGHFTKTLRLSRTASQSVHSACITAPSLEPDSF